MPTICKRTQCNGTVEASLNTSAATCPRSSYSWKTASKHG